MPTSGAAATASRPGTTRNGTPGFKWFGAERAIAGLEVAICPPAPSRASLPPPQPPAGQAPGLCSGYRWGVAQRGAPRLPSPAPQGKTQSSQTQFSKGQPRVLMGSWGLGTSSGTLCQMQGFDETRNARGLSISCTCVAPPWTCSVAPSGRVPRDFSFELVVPPGGPFTASSAPLSLFPRVPSCLCCVPAPRPEECCQGRLSTNLWDNEVNTCTQVTGTTSLVAPTRCSGHSPLPHAPPPSRAGPSLQNGSHHPPVLSAAAPASIPLSKLGLS